MVDIDIEHYGIDRRGNWATGRDYTYSDLKRKIQEIFKGVE